MKWLLGQVTGFFGVSPYQLLIIAAVVALAFTLGLAKGNYWATSRAIEETAKAVNAARDEEMARSNAALVEQAKRISAELDARAKANYQAAVLAHQTLLKERDQVRVDKVRAERALVAERTHNAELMVANEVLRSEVPPPAECVLSPRVRDILDEFVGAVSPVNGGYTGPDGSAGATGGPGEATASPPLTCDQLAHGYVNMSEWGRMGWAKYDAWRAFWKGLYP